MTTNIAVLANEVLQAFEMARAPIDPAAILLREGIELAPGTYAGDFDARLEYLPAEGIFATALHRPSGTGGPTVRSMNVTRGPTNG